MKAREITLWCEHCVDWPKALRRKRRSVTLMMVTTYLLTVTAFNLVWALVRTDSDSAPILALEIGSTATIILGAVLLGAHNVARWERMISEVAHDLYGSEGRKLS